MTHTIRIGNRDIGGDNPAYVIAEAGVNHNGSTDLALRLVEVAAEAGADSIKFQTFNPKALVVAGANTAEYQKRQTGLSDQQEMLTQLTLPADAWPRLQSRSAELGINFLSTPFDQESLELLVEMGLEGIKISSGDLTNHRFLRSVRSTGLPIMLSTGASFMQEVVDAVDALGGPHDLALLHCVTAYPSPIEHSNLRSLVAIAERVGCVSGWSDHSVGSVTAVAAIALGAKVIEKHITLDSTMPGPDHAASSEPAEFVSYISDIRNAERALGTGIKKPQESELSNRNLARRGWYAQRDLSVGDVLCSDDVVALRPQAGVPASASLTNRITTRRINAGEPIMMDDLVSP